MSIEFSPPPAAALTSQEQQAVFNALEDAAGRPFESADLSTAPLILPPFNQPNAEPIQPLESIPPFIDIARYVTDEQFSLLDKIQNPLYRLTEEEGHYVNMYSSFISDNIFRLVMVGKYEEDSREMQTYMENVWDLIRETETGDTETVRYFLDEYQKLNQALSFAQARLKKVLDQIGIVQQMPDEIFDIEYTTAATKTSILKSIYLAFLHAEHIFNQKLIMRNEQAKNMRVIYHNIEKLHEGFDRQHEQPPIHTYPIEKVAHPVSLDEASLTLARQEIDLEKALPDESHRRSDAPPIDHKQIVPFPGTEDELFPFKTGVIASIAEKLLQAGRRNPVSRTELLDLFYSDLNNPDLGSNRLSSQLSKISERLQGSGRYIYFWESTPDGIVYWIEDSQRPPEEEEAIVEETLDATKLIESVARISFMIQQFIDINPTARTYEIYAYAESRLNVHEGFLGAHELKQLITSTLELRQSVQQSDPSIKNNQSSVFRNHADFIGTLVNYTDSSARIHDSDIVKIQSSINSMVNAIIDSLNVPGRNEIHAFNASLAAAFELRRQYPDIQISGVPPDSGVTRYIDLMGTIPDHSGSGPQHLFIHCRSRHGTLGFDSCNISEINTPEQIEQIAATPYYANILRKAFQSIQTYAPENSVFLYADAPNTLP